MLHGSSSASFKMSATKNCEKCPSVLPSSPLCRPRYLTDSVHISNSFCWFSRILQQFEILWIHTSVRTAFITNLQSIIFKDRIDMLLSHYPEWEHEFLIMASLFPFSRILFEFRILCIHIDWCLSLDLLLPYSSQFFVHPVHSYHSYWP